MKGLITFLLVILLYSCAENIKQESCSYDVFLIAGQSNTHQGKGLDVSLDVSNPDIFQLGRDGFHNYRVVPAKEPLDHGTSLRSHIGFGLTFAKEYLKKYKADHRKILLIPCGYGESAFQNNQWNRGDSLYIDVVARTRYALSLNKNNRLIAILWHQGESDIGWPGYQAALDSMIINMRNDIAGNQNIPFLLGGMVPFWVDQDTMRMHFQKIIAQTPARVSYTAFVSPYFPNRIHKEIDTVTSIHYDAAGQRELGRRYFRVLDSLLQVGK